jgi:hypothetical protein
LEWWLMGNYQNFSPEFRKKFEHRLVRK